MPELNFSINGRLAKSGAKVVTKALKTIGSTAKSLVSTAFNPLTAALAAFGGFQGAMGLIKTADAYTTLAGQLEFVTGNAQDAATAQDELYRMSQKSRTSVTDNATALVKLSQANSMTHLSTSENIKVLGGLNALMLKTGTSGANASDAMLQLTQALSSGVLAGDEFKSIAENAPAVMQKFADALGVSRGELKKMASDGKVTTEVMVGALKDIAEEGEQSFSQLPKTVSSGWQLVVNAFEKAWVAINSETGITAKIFDMLVDLSEYIEDNQETFIVWATNMVDALVTAWPFISSVLMGMKEGMQAFFNYIYQNREGIIGFFTDLKDGIVWMYNTTKPAIEWLLESWGKLANLAKYTPLAAIARAAGAVAGGGGILDAGKALIDADGSLLTSGDMAGATSASASATGGAASVGNNSDSSTWWNGSESGGGGGVNITNNFNQNLSKSAIDDITTQQQRTAGRL